MPHIEQIHLPSFLSKKTVYETMLMELSEQCHDEFLSLSHFYALRKEEFAFCTIPKIRFGIGVELTGGGHVYRPSVCIII